MPGLFAGAAFALAVVAFLAILAAFVVSGGDARSASVVVIVAALPILGYVALRWPIVFPFGLYVMLVPFDPLSTLGGGTGATLTRFVGFAAAAALVLRALRTRRLLVPPKAWSAWGAVVLLMTASTMWSINPDATLPILQIVLQQYLLYTIVATYPIDGGQFAAIRRIVIAAGTVVALYGFYAYATGQRLNGTRLSISNGKLHFDPNHYAAFFLLPLGFLVAGFLLDRRPLRRALFAALILAMSANVFLTGSRGGLLSVVVLMIYLGFRTRRYASLASIGACFLALSAAIPNVWARFADKTQGDASGRGDIWSSGFQALRHYWAFGSGFATYADAYDQNLLNSVQRTFAGWHRPAHNLLVQSSVEFGLAGLALVLFAWWTSLRQNRDIAEHDPLYTERLACEAVVVGLFCAAMSIDVLWFKYLWLGMMLPVILANLAHPRFFWAGGGRANRLAAPLPAYRRPPPRATVTSRAPF